MIGRVLLALLVILGVLAELARPPEAGPIQLAFFGALFGAILTVFGFIADKAVTVAVTIAQAAIMIGQAIAQFSILVAGVFARVGGFLASFWSNVLRPFVTWSAEQVTRLAGWLRRTLEPLIKFLNDLRIEIQKIYDRWFRPIFDAIDTTRRILQVLATLHVPFARELDRKLAELEAFLLKPILELYRLVNAAQDWINRIVTLNGLLQRLTLLQSLLEYERDTFKVWWRSVHRRQSETGASPTGPADQHTPAQTAANVVAYARGNEDVDRPRMREHVADVLPAFRNLHSLPR